MKPTVAYAMFDYVECNFGNLHVSDADNNRLCAKNASISSYEDLWTCATGYGPDSGPGMLLASAQAADAAGVHSAPTVMLNGKMLGHTLTLQQVCDAYTGTKPPGCNQPAALLASKAAAADPKDVCML